MKTETRISLLLFLCALVLRTIYLFEMSSGPYFVSPQLDELNFDLWARRIAFEGVWSADGVFARGPLYPAFLGLCYKVFGHDYFVPRLLQALVGSAGVAALYGIGRRAFGRRAALAGSILAALWPTLIFFDGELLIESLAVTLDLLALLLLLRWSDRPDRLGRIALAGAVCGLSALARPNILLVMPFFAVWCLWVARYCAMRWPRAITQVSVLALATLAFILPATLHNRIAGRGFVLVSSQGGINFYVGNNPAATGYSAATPRKFRYWTEYEDSVDLFARRQAGIETGREMKPSEVSRYWSRKAWKWIAENPGRAAALTLKKAVLFWSAIEICDDKSVAFVARFSRLLSALVFLLPFGLVAPLALAQTVRQKHNAAQALLGGFVVCYMASVVAFFVYGRYRMPVVPIVLLFAAQFVATTIGLARERRFRPAAGGLLVAAAFAVLVWGDFYGVRRAMNQRRADDCWIAANGYMSSGRYDEAVEFYRQALALRPAYTDAWLNLGKTLFLAENYPDADRAFAKVLEIDPANAAAMSNRALCLAATGRGAEAETLWRKAVSLESDNPFTLTEFGRFLIDAGRFGEARPMLERAYAVHPRDVEPVLLLARLAKATGDAASALRWTEIALRLDPETTRSKLNDLENNAR